MKYCKNIAATVGAAEVDQLTGARAYCISEIYRELNASTRGEGGAPLASIRVVFPLPGKPKLKIKLPERTSMSSFRIPSLLVPDFRP